MARSVSLRLLFSVVMFAFNIAAVSAEPYPWEPEIVQLEGELRLEEQFGPPNYGETPEEDLRLKVYVLELRSPISVGTRGSFSEVNARVINRVDRVQVFFMDFDAQKHDIPLGKVSLRGSLSEQLTVREYYRVILRACSVNVAESERPVCLNLAR